MGDIELEKKWQNALVLIFLSRVSMLNLCPQSPAAVALITEKDDEGFSPVHYAAKSGDIKVAMLDVSYTTAQY